MRIVKQEAVFSVTFRWKFAGDIWHENWAGFCFLSSVGLLYEVNKLSGMMLCRSESKTKREELRLTSQ
ncbi:hypothetical protein Ancab_037357 [Ancistrocladus abbreviatus]